MLADKSAVATIAVKDIDVARKFYGSTLGLKEAEAEEPGVVTYRTGNSEILVYESQYAGTNKATAATWGVGDDLENVVQDIRSRGVAFEHYDLPDTTREGDIHVAGDMKVAWFKDPDGNILAIVNQ
jgi:catechol 2,3-dioxygenase-like lactoylglutathione lyase family enzyme